MTSKQSFRSTVGFAIVGSAALSANAAIAQVVQNPDDAQKTGVQEIIVTAQKREESLQDTPISIAVLDDRALEDRGINSVTDLVDGAVPSLRATPFAGRSSALSIGMRGIVPIDATQISRDPAIGIYVDGVYLGRVQGLGTELADVQRIEVLRGPQGTLFGRNAVGGALNIVSKQPTGQFGLDLALGARSRGGYDIEGHLNLPEFAGISVKLDGLWTRQDGWVDNPLAGQSDFADYERRGLRATAAWRPSNSFELRYSYEVSQDESASGYAHITQILPGGPALAPLFSVDQGRARVARAGFPLGPSVADVEAHSIHGEWDAADWLTVRSITAWRDLGQSQDDNFAGAFFGFRPNGGVGRISRARVDQSQFSQELQLVGTLDQLEFVLGAFYFEEDAADSAGSGASGRFNSTGTAITLFPPMAIPPSRASVARAESRAVFGQATWTPPAFGDRLHLTGGLRYTDDDKSGELTLVNSAPANIGFQFASQRVDPLAVVAFDVTPDVNAYLRYSTAYRAGGANSRSLTFRSFDEEEVEAWEAGVKADLFDGLARVNLAAYRNEYKDRQAEFRNPADPSGTETVNSSERVIIKGAELDVTVVPATGLTLSGSYVYTTFTQPDDPNPFTGGIERNVVPLTPEHAATAAIDYTLAPFDFGVLRVHAAVIYSGPFFTSSGLPKHGEHTLFNGRLSLDEIPLGRTGAQLELSLWGKNLTNAEYQTFVFDLASRGLTFARVAYYNEPRSGGIRATIRY